MGFFTKKILVVDDEPAILANLQALLETRGYKVVVASEGRGAVDLAREARPDMVLLDVKLPVLDGLEVCRVLKEDRATRRIPIVMLSGLDTLGDVDKAVACGADDYLTKPLDTEKLLEVLKKYA
ncbi:MAG: response regulator [Elusimicrobia bacterium]|nr:response regulator [Elusimicrobiota bacterium]